MKRLRTVFAYISLIVFGFILFYSSFAEETRSRKVLAFALTGLVLLWFILGLADKTPKSGDRLAPPASAYAGRSLILTFSRLLVGSVFMLLAVHFVPSVPDFGRFFLYGLSGIGIVASLAFLLLAWTRRS